MDTEEISTLKRVTKGVRLMRLGEGVKIVSAAAVEREKESDEELTGEVNETNETNPETIDEN